MSAEGADPLAQTPTFHPGEPQTFVTVVEEARSWRQMLDPDGTWTIGRAEECELRLDDQAASRRHAELRAVGGVVTVRDLSSHNGTTVNREPVRGERTLVSGDVVTVCATTLAFHAPAPRRREPQLVEPPAFHAHVALELDRALAAGRRLGVIVVQLGPADVRGRRAALLGALRPFDVAAFDGDARLILAFPEAGADELAMRAANLLTVCPGAAMAGAVAPDDAVDLGVLLATARDVAATARPGEYLPAARTARRIELGRRNILIAEPAMLRLYNLLERIAPSMLPVLVLGETGVGKESVVEAVHHRSGRAQAPLVAVNCAALPDTLAESALFGHERGAFSGAVTAQPGTFEGAHGGTLFLDEVGELSLAVQAKLLRALDGNAITRLGATVERHVDVRIIAATNRDLRAEIDAGRFREDLYFRLSGALVRVPPLRERPRELPILVRELLAQACARLSRPVPELGVAAMDALARYRWPGNVRELKNAMDFIAAALDPLGDHGGAELIELWHLPTDIAGPLVGGLAASAASAPSATQHSTPSRFRPIAEELRELERRRMIQALTATDGIQTRAAELLQMPRRTFVARMREYDLHALFPRAT